jgi:RND superfamily putative drug exporter
VGFGVLLDTFVVRSLVVPAAVAIIGDTVWWPSKLARTRPSAELSSPTREDTPVEATTGQPSG